MTIDEQKQPGPGPEQVTAIATVVQEVEDGYPVLISRITTTCFIYWIIRKPWTGGPARPDDWTLKPIRMAEIERISKPGRWQVKFRESMDNAYHDILAVAHEQALRAAVRQAVAMYKKDKEQAAYTKEADVHFADVKGSAERDVVKLEHNKIIWKSKEAKNGE